MKKYLLSIAVLLMGTTVLTSCDDDDDDNVNPPHVTCPVDVNLGVYVVNSGNQSGQIDGGLTYLNAETWASEKDVFAKANGRSLGITANDGIVYGTKLYIAVTGENTIEVMDNSTLKSLKQINTVNAIGEGKGNRPRHFAAGNGCIYVSTFAGYVAAIDTATYEVVKTYPTTPETENVNKVYPEGMAVNGNTLYVANSSYGNGQFPSIGKIDLTTGNVTLFTDELINNPNAVYASGNDLYVLDYGKYDASWNQVGAGVKKISGGKVSDVVPATNMAVAGTKIYTYNAPYTTPATVPSYSVYDMTTGKTAEFIAADSNDAPFSAAAISADPIRGYVYIASYIKNEDTGYPDYKANGYLNVYDLNGKLVKTCPTGVGPTAIIQNTTVVYE